MFLTLVLVFFMLSSVATSNVTDLQFIPCNELDIKNGKISLEISDVSFVQIATIRCQPSFDLYGPDKLACVNGNWQPAAPIICMARCVSPPYLKDGSVEVEGDKADGMFKRGSLAKYSCAPGYDLIPLESKFRECKDGIWTGTTGFCIGVKREGCKAPEPLKNGYYVHENVDKSGEYGIGERLHYSCSNGYEIFGTPIQTCLVDGTWSPKIPPKCIPLQGSRECEPPPKVPHATMFNLNTQKSDVLKTHFTHTQVSYSCYPGYEIRGQEILTCNSGCWVPREPPICVSVEEAYFESPGSTSSRILASLASGVCVLLLLVVICLVVICKKRKPLSRAVSIQPTVPRPDLGDHASLLHPPDRLALIAFADGIQAAQPVLPTYEEAVRDSRGFISARIHRPHWPLIAARRSRNSPNPDNIHVNRQGSFASHSASLRSDPMGSTDTMAVSENSTTVTLETVSSHSGSQPASCRAHCGSLASFDTSSVLNNEGVPLLEENELEEVQGDSISLAMENRSMTDNSSFKLSTGSDIH
ncbi:sushi domain-containing protein 4-like isoform X2 [Onthophagus taurus]|uniref:sushi domain-containing protein 4-like isoform X2 n=1 Tax=Onthophagus taurus TaxID=166361 RepID=UPI000C1FE548|nr:sushi, von Willebrand factor type A, EGF and pentraxin domain-containing protein 1-like isoform X2 [Onthophagus taurus]